MKLFDKLWYDAGTGKVYKASSKSSEMYIMQEHCTGYNANRQILEDGVKRLQEVTCRRYPTKVGKDDLVVFNYKDRYGLDSIGLSKVTAGEVFFSKQFNRLIPDKDIIKVYSFTEFTEEELRKQVEEIKKKIKLLRNKNATNSN